MKQQKIYRFDGFGIGVSNCDNEEEARKIIKKQAPELLSEITETMGIEHIRYEWLSDSDIEEDRWEKYHDFTLTSKLGRGAIKVFAFSTL